MRKLNFHPQFFSKWQQVRFSFFASQAMRHKSAVIVSLLIFSAVEISAAREVFDKVRNHKRGRAAISCTALKYYSVYKISSGSKSGRRLSESIDT